MTEPDDLLSVRLRRTTAPLHAKVERVLGLPGAVRYRQDYCRLLGRFLGIYEPLEQVFQRFDDWDRLGLAPASHAHVVNLTLDLSALGIDLGRLPRAPPRMLPNLPTFPHALGALYVLEGATLGGRVILRALESRMGGQIAGASRFLGGQCAAAGPTWQSFRASLDDFGRAQPGRCVDVLSGADRMFRANLAWFTARGGIGGES
jgi:heme oxygenase